MNEIRALTGLRGLAALIVFWGHTREALASRGLEVEIPLLIERLFLAGGRQVDIFFVLSGFIMALIYRSWFTGGLSRTAYFQFLRRRVARIWPLHVFILLLVIATVVASQIAGLKTNHGTERFDYATLPQHLLMVHAWGPFMEGPGAWNPPSWSVSIEWLAYFVFPFLIWGTARWSTRPWLPIIAMVIIGFALNAQIFWGLSGLEGVTRGLSQFALGCLMANLYGSRTAEWLQTRLGSTLAMLLLVVGFALLPETGFIVGVLTAPLLLALCSDSNAPARFFGSKPMFFLGEISYSIYLGHFLFTSIAYRLISVEWMKTGVLEAVAGVLLINAFVIGVSTLSYYFVEQPGRDLLSGRRKRLA